MNRVANALLLAGAIGMWVAVLVPWPDLGFAAFTLVYGMSYLLLGAGILGKALVLAVWCIGKVGLRE